MWSTSIFPKVCYYFGHVLRTCWQAHLPPCKTSQIMYLIGGMSHGHFWSYRLTVRTSGFHPGNRGSIPRRITEYFLNKSVRQGAFIIENSCDPKQANCFACVGESKGGALSSKARPRARVVGDIFFMSGTNIKKSTPDRFPVQKPMKT